MCRASDIARDRRQALAQTINDFTFDNGAPDFTTLVDVKDVGIGSANDIRFPEPQGFLDPNTTPCLPMEPFEVYEDAANGVRIQAILVDHHQVFPSFAFRFDTDDGSVVISGDTSSDTKGNLQRLASGADVLVHEVIDRAWIDQLFRRPSSRLRRSRRCTRTSSVPTRRSRTSGRWPSRPR